MSTNSEIPWHLRAIGAADVAALLEVGHYAIRGQPRRIPWWP